MIRTIHPSEPELIRLCRSETWVSVEARTRSHPNEALPTDLAVRGEASTALSVAVRSRAPLAVLRQLVQANFQQVGVTHVLRGTIVHEGLRYRSEDAVIDLLIKAAIQYNEDNSTCKRGNLLGHTDDIGRTALHYMVDRIIRSFDKGERNQTDWDLLQRLVQACPSAISTIDADGTTPLVQMLLLERFSANATGAALEHEIFQIVHMMVAACPMAAKIARRLPRPWHYHFVKDSQATILQGDGVPTPLSCALMHGRSEDTVNLLLEASRQIGVKSCRTLVTHYHEIPLHIAVTMRCPPVLLSKLIQEDRAVVGVADVHGLTPLDWMWIRHALDWFSSSDPSSPISVSRRRYIHNNFLVWHGRVSNQYLGNDTASGRESCSQVQGLKKSLKDDLLERMLATLPETALQSIESETDQMIEDDLEMFPLVHSTAFVPCPLAMVKFACDTFPEQLWSRDKRLGRLPLHYAASRGGYRAQLPVGVSDNVQGLEEVSPLALVLSMYPTACRIADNNNRLPLHIAIDYAKEAIQNRDIFREGPQQEDCQTDVETLVQTYPESIHRRDGVTKLLPFLQAAEGDDADVDLTFRLLRRDPSLVKQGCWI